MQVHKSGSEINVYTRALKDVTASVPEIVEALHALPVQELILDGEAVALAPDGSPQRVPMSLYPFISGHADNRSRPIVIDPALAFGRPIVVQTSVTTQAISERIDAGESVEDLAVDYDLTPLGIEEAVLYEHAA